MIGSHEVSGSNMSVSTSAELRFALCAKTREAWKREMSRSEAEYPAYLHQKSGTLPQKTPDLETNQVFLLGAQFVRRKAKILRF